MSEFREAVMEALDNCYERTGGNTPDHIIIAQTHYERLEKKGKLEEPGDREWRHNPDKVGQWAYLGMTVWPNSHMDHTNEVAILISDEVFWESMPQAKDFYE
jgi:hypothetical protein